MLNLETWSGVLSATDRERLRAHLPAAETPAAQDAAVRALLTREPLSLDTPPLELPPAYQVASPFGADIGGTNPLWWGMMAETQYDSWLTVGATDGSSKGS